MVFPDSERVIYDNNPLKQVICQLRFSAILAITSKDKEPADFQDRVRGIYPEYERTFSPIPKELADMFPVPPEGLIHKFQTVDHKHEIDLAQHFIAVATTEYTRWENFEEAIRLATGALEQIYAPPFYSRIGLRYINVIERENCGLGNVPWGQLIRSSIAGLVAESDLTGRAQITQSQALVRLDQPNEYLTLRSGLIPQPGGTEKYDIDADFYRDGNTAPAETLSILERFNGEARNFFHWATREQLRTALGPRPFG